MQCFEHLITTRPHDIVSVLISDLHLSDDQPVLVQAFVNLLDDLLVLPQLQRLFILGDWFDAWIGDDAYFSLSAAKKLQHWLTPMLHKLTALNQQGCEILVMHGNRDFLVGQAFCNVFGGQLIFEPYFINVSTQCYRLEHGDALCIDDKAYQRFRRLIRSRLVTWYLTHRPLQKRMQIAERLRQKSKDSNASKSAMIMDVNADAVRTAVNNLVTPCNALIHGHTHRPAIHSINNSKNPKQRYVLGDWRVVDKHDTNMPPQQLSQKDMVNIPSSHLQVSAIIGVICHAQNNFKNIRQQQEFILCDYRY